MISPVCTPPFLIADLMHEDQMKLKTARRLDKIKDARANDRRRHVVGDTVRQQVERGNRNGDVNQQF